MTSVNDIFTFIVQKYAFLFCLMMIYPLCCLLNMSIFIIVKFKKIPLRIYAKHIWGIFLENC